MALCDKGEVTSHFWLPILCANKNVSVMKGNSGEHKMTLGNFPSITEVLAAGSCFVGDALNKWIGLWKKKNETLICFRCKSQILSPPPPPLCKEETLQETQQPWSKRGLSVTPGRHFNVIQRKWLLIPEQENTNISICLFRGDVREIDIE